jgi:hypothetical protein
MHLVYQHASRLVAWLGTETEDSELALRKLEYIGMQIEYTSVILALPAPAAKEHLWWKSEPP